MEISIIPESKSTINQSGHLFNPFPGLRPFATEESHLFFGREGQSQEVLKFLADNRFVALLGTSGSGKSSLMYCGVIPILQGGFITKAGVDWEIITCRPGQNPIKNLGDSLLQKFNSSTLDIEFQAEYIYSTLERSSLGLVQVIKEMPRRSDQNILILVDQFEELFRFKHIKNSIEAQNEVVAYIKLLLEALNNKDLPIYIVMTMRSDFIGECAQYQELTKLINDSHYLIPQMTRDDFRQAIEGPVAVGGGSISLFLVQQLLNDIGDNPDQLPILQHALMRTWDNWIKTGNTETAINVRDYENVGKLEKALSEHANEAYNELSSFYKEISQIIFKTLTEKGGDNRGVRRPTAISEIAEIGQCSTDQVIEVVDHFRQPGRSFLSPGVGTKLNADSVIDISHESLMRIWDKLSIWVSEEYDAVQMYKRLAESAEKYQLGEASLWRPPDLQVAVNWRDKQKPTLTWAKRHNPAFERTMVFLETSYKEYQLEEENKIKQQRKALRRTRVFAVVLGTASIISLFFMINSFIAQREAVKQSERANEQTEIANKEKINAVNQQQIAEEQKQIAQQKQIEAEEQKKIAETEQQNATRNAKEALRQKEIANQKSIEAEQQKVNAEASANVAKQQQKLAEQASLQAQKLRMLSIAQSMAVKSLQINIDTNLRGLMAYQAYEFNNKYGGNPFNPDIYNGLYFSHKFFYGNRKSDFVKHKNPVKSLCIDPITQFLYSTGSDGLIMKWGIWQNQDTNSYYNTNQTNRILLMSPDNKFLITGTSGGNIIQLNLSAKPVFAEVVYSFTHPVNTLVYLNESKLLATSNKGEWVTIDLPLKSASKLNVNVIIKECYNTTKGILALDSEGRILKIDPKNPENYEIMVAKFGEDGKKIRLVNVSKTESASNGIKINAINISNDGNFFVIGDIEGNITVFDANTNVQKFYLTGHTARINQLVFDSGSKFLGSASNDGLVLIWNTSDFNQAPLTLSDNSAWALSLQFTPEGNAVFVGYADGKIRRWLTSSEKLAEEVRLKMIRNFTTEEWNQYVAKDIDYVKTIELE